MNRKLYCMNYVFPQYTGTRILNAMLLRKWAVSSQSLFTGFPHEYANLPAYFNILHTPVQAYQGQGKWLPIVCSPISWICKYFFPSYLFIYICHFPFACVCSWCFWMPSVHCQLYHWISSGENKILILMSEVNKENKGLFFAMKYYYPNINGKHWKWKEEGEELYLYRSLRVAQPQTQDSAHRQWNDVKVCSPIISWIFIHHYNLRSRLHQFMYIDACPNLLP